MVFRTWSAPSLLRWPCLHVSFLSCCCLPPAASRSVFRQSPDLEVRGCYPLFSFFCIWFTRSGQEGHPCFSLSPSPDFCSYLCCCWPRRETQRLRRGRISRRLRQSGRG